MEMEIRREQIRLTHSKDSFAYGQVESSVIGVGEDDGICRKCDDGASSFKT
jgi:hypothetical protein